MRKILVSIVVILMLFSIISVKAEDLKVLNFVSDKYEIEKGEEVVLTISSNELTGIEGILKYDSSVLTLTKKESQNSFTLNEEKESNAFGKFALANFDGEEKITVKLTFKSKEDTTAENTVISVLEIVGSDKTGGGYDISDKDVTIKFKAKPAIPPMDSEKDDPNTNPGNPPTDSEPGNPPTDSEPSNPPTDSEPSNPPTDSEPSNPSTDSKPSNPSTDSKPENKPDKDPVGQTQEQKPNQTIKNIVNKVEKIPEAGSENVFAIIIIIGIVAGIAYFRYKKYNF